MDRSATSSLLQPVRTFTPVPAQAARTLLDISFAAAVTSLATCLSFHHMAGGLGQRLTGYGTVTQGSDAGAQRSDTDMYSCA